MTWLLFCSYKKVDSKEIRESFKRWGIDLLISVPCAFLFMKVIELKYTFLFWSFYAIMAISALICEWYEHVPYSKKTKFQKISEHTLFISFFTMMVWWLIMGMSEWINQ